METISVDVFVTLGINGPCMTASMEDIGVVSTVYTLRQLVLPAEETCMQKISINKAYILVDSERFHKLTSGKLSVTTGFSWA